LFTLPSLFVHTVAGTRERTSRQFLSEIRKTCLLEYLVKSFWFGNNETIVVVVVDVDGLVLLVEEDFLEVVDVLVVDVDVIVLLVDVEDVIVLLVEVVLVLLVVVVVISPTQK